MKLFSRILPDQLKCFQVLDSQGYLWLPYDLVEAIKLIGETFGLMTGFEPWTLESRVLTARPS